VRSPQPAETDLGQFTRREADALLLYLRPDLPAVRPLENRPKLLCHLLDGVSEVGQLSGDQSWVLVLASGCYRKSESVAAETGAGYSSPRCYLARKVIRLEPALP
jgi:hypothetical protein